MDADIFVSGKKKLRIQKYPDTCGRGLSVKISECFLSVNGSHESVVRAAFSKDI